MRFATVPGPPRKPLALANASRIRRCPRTSYAGRWQEPVHSQCSNFPVPLAVRWRRLRLRSRLCYGLPLAGPGVPKKQLAWLFGAPGCAKCHRCSCSCTGSLPCMSFGADPSRCCLRVRAAGCDARRPAWYMFMERPCMARQHDTSAVREAGCSIASPVRTDQRGPLGMAGRIAVVVLRHRQEGGAPGVIPRSSICLSST